LVLRIAIPGYGRSGIARGKVDFREVFASENYYQ
jgi:hypothetical protein